LVGQDVLPADLARSADGARGGRDGSDSARNAPSPADMFRVIWQKARATRCSSKKSPPPCWSAESCAAATTCIGPRTHWSTSQRRSRTSFARGLIGSPNRSSARFRMPRSSGASSDSVF
jgi:hypothetical protein